MPEGEGSRYYRRPRPESIAAFTRFLSTKDHVSEIQQIKPQVFMVRRERMSDLLVYLTNLYIVGEADIYEILEEEPKVNAIVTMSAWNSYTQDAKETCTRQRIGLFKFKEFMGAVWFDGKQFLGYVHPDDSEKGEDR